MKPVIFVSELVDLTLLSTLQHLGEVIVIQKLDKCYEAVASHSDIQLVVIEKELFIDADAYQNVMIDMSRLDNQYEQHLNIVKSNLGNRYPFSVPFNGKFIPNKSTWIHNMNFTDEEILCYISKNDIETIQVSQGYCGCSLLMVTETSGITSDLGIHKALRKLNYDIMLIESGDINLPGMDYGFIGGCCGVYDNIVYINGDLNTHKNGAEIKEFIAKYNLSTYEIKDKPLFDIGGIIFWSL